MIFLKLELTARMAYELGTPLNDALNAPLANVPLNDILSWLIHRVG